MNKPLRARELGFILPGLPTGTNNTITDVAGVTIGHCTLHDDSPLHDHKPPIHTGATLIIPHQGDLFNEKLVAAAHTINGFGKAAGFEQVREMGTLETPVALTNTLCVGRAWDGIVTWMLERHPEIGTTGPSVNPVVAECNDSRLNDLRGRHVTGDHILQALTAARPGPVQEGSTGAGAGMVCYGYKGGIGTASRMVDPYTLGALVLANFGRRDQLTIRGVPVGKLLSGKEAWAPPSPGSVIIILATDAPLTSRQLGRLARRADLGLARTGSTVSSGSGDFVLAFSTGQKILAHAGSVFQLTCLPDSSLDPFFQAVVEAVEEAVLNALCTATPVLQASGKPFPALPVDETLQILKGYRFTA